MPVDIVGVDLQANIISERECMQVAHVAAACEADRSRLSPGGASTNLPNRIHPLGIQRLLISMLELMSIVNL